MSEEQNNQNENGYNEENNSQGDEGVLSHNSSQIKAKIPSDSKPDFSNSIKINVSNDMVSLQFAYIRPGQDNGIIVSEVVFTPQHAIELQKKLRDTLSKHFTDQIE